MDCVTSHKIDFDDKTHRKLPPDEFYTEGKQITEDMTDEIWYYTYDSTNFELAEEGVRYTY